VTIEARHASVIGLIIDESAPGITPDGPVDTPYTADQVLTAVAATGFITGGLPTGDGGGDDRHGDDDDDE
jgi:hypothetical protein